MGRSSVHSAGSDWSGIVEDCIHEAKPVQQNVAQEYACLLREYAESLEDRLRIHVDIAVEKWLQRIEEDQEIMYRQIQHKFMIKFSELSKTVSGLQAAVRQLRTSASNPVGVHQGAREKRTPSRLSGFLCMDGSRAQIPSTCPDFNSSSTTAGQVSWSGHLDGSSQMPEIIGLKRTEQTRALSMPPGVDQLRRGCMNPQRRRDAAMGCHKGSPKCQRLQKSFTPPKSSTDAAVQSSPQDSAHFQTKCVIGPHESLEL